MKYKIDFDQSSNYVYIQTDGKASVDGFDKLLTELINSPKWQTGKKQLIDHRKLEAKELSSGDIQKIKIVVRKHSPKLGNGSCAFVVNDELGFGLIRMYEMFGGNDIHQDVAIFYTLEEGVEWLSI